MRNSRRRLTRQTAENVDLAEEKRALSEALEAERVAKQAAVARLEAQAAEAERRAVESEEKLKEEAAARRQHEVDIAKLSDALQLAVQLRPEANRTRRWPPARRRTPNACHDFPLPSRSWAACWGVLVFELAMYRIPVEWVINHRNA